MNAIRYIAFLDILGFADQVEHKPLDEIIHKISLSLQSLQVAQHLSVFLHDQGKEGFGLAVNAKCLEAFSFSDTFVLSSRDASPASFYQLIAGTAVLAQHLFSVQFPVRGALTCGEADFVPGTNHLVGKAIIRAARLEKIQDWFGVIIDPSFPNSESLSQFPLIKPLVVKYDVPWKSNAGFSGPCWTINWRFNLEAENGISSLFQQSEDDENKRKVQNTLNYCKFLRSNNLAYGSLRTEKGEQIHVPWLRGMWLGQKPPGTPGNKHGDEY